MEKAQEKQNKTQNLEEEKQNTHQVRDEILNEIKKF